MLFAQIKVKVNYRLLKVNIPKALNAKILTQIIYQWVRNHKNHAQVFEMWHLKRNRNKKEIQNGLQNDPSKSFLQQSIMKYAFLFLYRDDKIIYGVAITF